MPITPQKINFDSIYGKVYQILTDVPTTRDSDKRLICEYYKRSGIDINAPFAEVIESKAPSFESIRRNRQLVQAKFPELSASEEITVCRADLQEQVHLFTSERGVQ